MGSFNETPAIEPGRAGGGPGWRFIEWLFGIVGAIGLFLGLFILLANDNQYVGVGGDWSWRVGDVSSAWTYGLLVGGGVLLCAALVMIVLGTNRSSASRHGNKALADLWWHVGIFTTVNAFIWVQDFAIGGGLDYALWVTIPWAAALGIHAFAYLYAQERDRVPTITLIAGDEKELEHNH